MVSNEGGRLVDYVIIGRWEGHIVVDSPLTLLVVTT